VVLQPRKANIVVTCSNDYFVTVSGVAYTGVDQNVPSNVTTNTGSGTFGSPVSGAINVAGSRSWIVGMVTMNSGGVNFSSPIVIREQPRGGFGPTQIDSGSIAPAGSYTYNGTINSTSGFPTGWGTITAELPAAN
jgi:hypothetical protein